MGKAGVISGRGCWTAAVTVMMACSTILTGTDHATAGGSPAPTAPVPRLDWRPCVPGGPFDCATATVPLDHDDPGGRTVGLAVVRHRATGPGRRVGTLFFNPGGPGGPGTVQMPQLYPFFPREVRERFDIVSWDPRGIGSSTAVDCFATPQEATAWTGTKPAGIPVGAKQQADTFAAYRDLARRCERRDPELLRHVSTADSARDLDLLRQAVGDPRLTYFGISYGTFLGATYANLFPGRVRAMTLDSNVDARAYADGALGDAPLTTFLRLGSDRSAAEVLERFLTLCGSTTTARCAFSAGDARATREKFDELMRRLRTHPVGDWTYGRTAAQVVSGLYVVDPGWTDVARALQRLWQGRAPEQAQRPAAPPVPHPDPYLGDEQAAAVLCGESPNPRTPGAYPALEERAAARAGDAGRVWTWAAVGCFAWPAVAADRYSGPWNRPTAPLLLVGTRHDPATPYAGARALADELADARLLTLDGYGHTALINPSACVARYESRYLIDGTLPPPGTTCHQDTAPFPAPTPVGSIATGGGALARHRS